VEQRYLRDPALAVSPIPLLHLRGAWHHSLPRGARLTSAMGTGSCGSSMITGRNTPALGNGSRFVPEILVPVSAISLVLTLASESLAAHSSDQ